MKIWLVFEDTIIWAAFTKRLDAYEFRRREFVGNQNNNVLPHVAPLVVRTGLGSLETQTKSGFQMILINAIADGFNRLWCIFTGGHHWYQPTMISHTRTCSRCGAVRM